jgi:hypothetical protein
VNRSTALIIGEAGRIRSDPLGNSRRATAAVCEIVTQMRSGARRVLWRTGNKGGKTTDMAAVFVAMARGRRELDARLIGASGPYQPLMLPHIRCPNVGLLVVNSYKQGYLSAVAAYARWLGPETVNGKQSWKPITGPQGTMSAMLVRPDGWKDDSTRTWSRIEIYTDEGPLPEGVRADWAHPDEPCSWRMFEEVTNRGRLGEPYYVAMTATPLYRKEWYWMPGYWNGPVGTVYDGRLEIQSAAFDNQAMSEDDRAEVLSISRGSKLEKARLYGEYVDDTGTCPFGYDGLQKWLARCREPEMVWDYGDDRELYVWRDRDEDDEYLVVCDTSSGIKDEKGEHCPSRLDVLSRKRMAQVAAFEGYTRASKLGEMAARVAKHFNRAMVVPEMNYNGEAFVDGLNGYANVYMREQSNSLNSNRSAIGWYTTSTNRGSIIDALGVAIDSDAVEVPDVRAVRQLLGVQVDHLGRVAKGPGLHDEAMITLGIGCHLLETLPAVRKRTQEKPWTDPLEEALDHETIALGLGRRKRVSVEAPEAW